MRILSQDGMIDVPYEQVIVEIGYGKDKNIIAYTETGGDDSLHLATYSTEAKAKKAMKMLRDKYLEHLYSRGEARTLAGFCVPAFAFVPPKVFQFPADDELEG